MDTALKIPTGRYSHSSVTMTTVNYPGWRFGTVAHFGNYVRSVNFIELITLLIGETGGRELIDEFRVKINRDDKSRFVRSQLKGFYSGGNRSKFFT